MIATLIVILIAVVFTAYCANKDIKLYNEYKKSGSEIDMFANSTKLAIVITILLIVFLLYLFFTN